MVKIKEIFENYNTKKTAKKYGRTFEQQKYRNDLAKDLRESRRREFGRDVSNVQLDGEKGNPEYFKSLGKGRKAGKDVAEALIVNGYGEYVAKNLENFEGLDYNAVAKALINEGEYETLADCLYSKKIRGLNKEIAIKLIENKEGVAVLRNFDLFEGLDKDVVQTKIKFGGLGELDTLEGIAGLDKDTAEMMIFDDYGGSWFVFENLDKFEGLVLDKNLAEKILEEGSSSAKRALLYYLDKFEGLDKEVAEKLIEAGYGDFVSKHSEKFGI